MPQRGKKRAHSPNIEPHKRNHEHPTPTRAKLQGAIEFLEARGLLKKNANTPIPLELPTKHDVYQYFQVPDRTGSRILNEDNPTEQDGEISRRGLHQGTEEKRGKKRAIGWEELKKMEDIVNDGNIRHRTLQWPQLASMAGLIGDKKVHWHTVRRAMQDMEYHKCIACTKNWLSADIRALRRTWARDFLPYKNDDWKRVRWSDEIHFGLGPEKKLRIIRRPGERLCWSCIQERGPPPEKAKDVEDEVRIHAWAAVGWNFKTPLIWYTTNNKNGKMSQKVYIDQILEPHVGQWIERGDIFELEEDRDSGHGPADNNNKIRRWKAVKGLKAWFNGPKSPDMSVIERCFQPLKQYLSNTGHWDEKTLRERAEKGWRDHVTQDFINREVLKMPDRVHALLDGDGRMTGY